MDTTTKILIVDDFPVVRKLLMRILKSLGFNVFIEAVDGKDAWETLEKQQIDLIIADWNMPEMTGLELLKKIRLSNTHKMIPFLMLTGEAEKQKIVEAVNAGVSDYVVKPFTAETILNKVGKILNNSSSSNFL